MARTRKPTSTPPPEAGVTASDGPGAKTRVAGRTVRVTTPADRPQADSGPLQDSTKGVP